MKQISPHPPLSNMPREVGDDKSPPLLLHSISSDSLFSAAANNFQKFRFRKFTGA